MSFSLVNLYFVIVMVCICTFRGGMQWNMCFLNFEMSDILTKKDKLVLKICEIFKKSFCKYPPSKGRPFFLQILPPFKSPKSVWRGSIHSECPWYQVWWPTAAAATATRGLDPYLIIIFCCRNNSLSCSVYQIRCQEKAFVGFWCRNLHESFNIISGYHYNLPP